jgi:hypothetical protein
VRNGGFAVVMCDGVLEIRDARTLVRQDKLVDSILRIPISIIVRSSHPEN